MATYAIGDVQGCFASLMGLLEHIAYDPQRDRLWFVGDLVNRGPDSLATLRFVKELGDRAVCVLGNHDLHLLAVAGGHGELREQDTLHATLDAPDAAALIDWLRERPLMHAEDGYAMVHAGLLPSWTVPRALELAHEVEQKLRGRGYDAVLASMYGNEPDRWSDALRGNERRRVIINAMTRMRVCTVKGVMRLRYKGDGSELPPGVVPWFTVPGRASRATPIIFGHWSALDLVLEPNVIGLDTGCLWGRKLSALRLENRRLFQFSCPGGAAAKPRR
jgi:bis(5'-nucleosyl)-tetraphosphatase (symmetrical)